MERDEQLWDRYTKQGDKTALSEIYQKYLPLINKYKGIYSGSMVPGDIIENDIKLIIAKSLHNYDPAKGPLPAYLNYAVRGIQRDVNQLSPLYIPERRSSVIGEFKNKLEALRGKLDREPTFEEMSIFFKLPISEIEKLKKETGRTILIGEEFDKATDSYHSPHLNVVAETVFNKLTDPREKVIVEHTFGLHGKRVIKGNVNLAHEIGTSESTVRNLKDNIIKEYNRTY